MTEDLVIVGATHRRTDKVSWALDLTGARWTYLKKNAYVMTRANAGRLIASRSSDRHDFFTETWAEGVLPVDRPTPRKATTPQPAGPSSLTHDLRPFSESRAAQRKGFGPGHIAIAGLVCVTLLALAALPGSIRAMQRASYKDGYHRAWREVELQYKACRVSSPDECHALASALLRMPLSSDVEPE